MKWHLYKKDDSNTFPEIDCPMVVYGMLDGEYLIPEVCLWDRKYECFYNKEEYLYYHFDECYYAYIGYVPSGYKTHKVTKCADKNYCKGGCDWYDDGYCLLTSECEQQRKVNEYSIEEKAIWKEFE